MTLSLRTGALAGLLVVGLAAGPAAAALPGQAVVADPARPAAGSYDPTTLLVAFEPGTPGAERRNAHAGLGAAVENTLEWQELDVVRLPRGLDPVDAAARYERNPNVAFAELNSIATLTTNDTLYADQWGLHNTGQRVTGSFVRGVADVDIDAPEGWDIAFGAGQLESTGGTLTGVLDTGIDRTHVDLLGRTAVCASATSAIGLVVEGTCSDDNLHGTHVAGTIAAETGNGVGVAGVAPNAPLAVFKGLNGAGTGFYADIIAGIHYLHTHGAKVISMSIGGPQSDALDKELSEAAAAGSLLIAAAGNDGDDTANYPAFHKDVVSVAAVDAAGKRARFSNCNSDVEIAAPGVDIWSTFPANAYGSISGTSMATPHVSGVAALLMSEKGLTAAQTRSALTSTDQGSAGCNSVGVVNLAAALGGTSGGGGTSEPISTGAIAGTVTAAKTKKAISGATVDCGTAGKATTATDGSYGIGSVPAGSYTCTASASGFRAKSSSVSVTGGQTTTANFALR
jgi:thermitase